MKSIKHIFIETIFQFLISAIIFGFGFYVLKIGLIVKSYTITFFFTILLIVALLAFNLIKENLIQNQKNVK